MPPASSSQGSPAGVRPDVEDLVERDRVHSRVYTDPEIFEAEIERIWRRCWIYAGHTSEVPEAGDYITREVAHQPIILVRGVDGEVRALLNRCPHRGNLVCSAERGSSKVLRCVYHSWSFNTRGELVGAPFPESYGDEFQEGDWDLRRVPHVDAYRGFVFVRFADDGPSLPDYLGAAASYIDRFCDLAPDGEVDLSAGSVRSNVHANWKLALENNVDGYHPAFLHRSVLSVRNYLNQAVRMGEEAPIVSRDLGDGHSIIDYSGQNRATGFIVNVVNMPAIPEEVKAEYARRLEERHGPAKAKDLIEAGTSPVNIFPNLMLTWQDVRTITPVSTDRSVLSHTPALLRGAPREINLARLRQQVDSYGPAGCLGADDVEMYDRSQAAFRATVDDRVLLSRGADTERTDAAGVTTGGPTDETAIRAFWRQYRSVMA